MVHDAPKETVYLVYESSLNGHRVQYIKHLLQYLVGRAGRVIVVLPEQAHASDEFRTELAGYESKVTFDFSVPPHPSSGVGNTLARWRSLGRAMRACGPCRVILPTADHLAQALWLFWFYWWHPAIRRSEVACVLLRLGPRNRRMSLKATLKQVVTFATLALYPWRPIWSIDPRAAGRRGPGLTVSYLPDPIAAHPAAERTEARNRLGLPANGWYVVCAGVLDERKGVDLLIRAFSQIAEKAGGTLLLAGEASAGVTQAIGEARSLPGVAERLVWTRRRLTDEEIARWVVAANLVCLPYVAHDGLSSLVLRAAACRRWILGCESGWIGETIRDRGLGWTCNPEEPVSFAAALQAALEQVKEGEGDYPPTGWLEQHSPTAFAAALIDQPPSKSQ